MLTHTWFPFCHWELTLKCFCTSFQCGRIMRIIIQISQNLDKTSIIALEGLQVWNIPIRHECSITTTPWPRSLASILLFFSECSLPSGTTGSQSDGSLGVNCELGVRRAFSQFTSTIQIPSCMGINEAHRHAPARDWARGQRHTVSSHGHGVRSFFKTRRVENC